MTVNLSLIEQSLGRATHNYWLRVGVMFDDDSAPPVASAENASPPSPHRDDADGVREGGTGTVTGGEVHDAPRAAGSAGDDRPDDADDTAQTDMNEVGLKSPGLDSADSSEEDSARGQGRPVRGLGSGVEAERLYTLAVLSSDVAKWLIPCMDDWVELPAVRSALQTFFYGFRLLHASHNFFSQTLLRGVLECNTMCALCFSSSSCRWIRWSTTW
jgi:hypothetical protein